MPVRGWPRITTGGGTGASVISGNLECQSVTHCRAARWSTSMAAAIVTPTSERPRFGAQRLDEAFETLLPRVLAEILQSGGRAGPFDQRGNGQ